MSGLIILVVLGIWGFVSYSLARMIGTGIKNEKIKIISNCALMTLVFIAPVADDIAGGFQFRALCDKGAVLNIDEQKAKDKTVVYQRVKDRHLTSYIVPILERYWSYKDIESEEILVSWRTYEAQGGWLSRAIGFPQGSPPYTFDGKCYTKNARGSIFKKLNITVKDQE